MAQFTLSFLSLRFLYLFTFVLADIDEITKKTDTDLLITQLSQDSNIITDTNEIAVSKVTCSSQKKFLPRNCLELKNQGFYRSGVYTIYPITTNPVKTFCDMVTDGGGWTVFQRRGVPLDPHEIRMNFYRNWNEYDLGFGSAERDYWLGLGNIAALCSLGDCELRIDMTDWNGEYRYAHYKAFSISDRSDSYRATFAEFSGNANNGTNTTGDNLAYHSGQQFSTYDHGSTNCSAVYQGAWWYKSCHFCHLNGLYAKDKTGVAEYGKGIVWYDWHGYYYSLMQTEMKIRSRYV